MNNKDTEQHLVGIPGATAEGHQHMLKGLGLEATHQQVVTLHLILTTIATAANKPLPQVSIDTALKALDDLDFRHKLRDAVLEAASQVTIHSFTKTHPQDN